MSDVSEFEEQFQPIEIQEEMERSFLDYSMSVIVSRALPDARDGLKPVQRRILYVMHDTGLRPETPYRKSARIVNDSTAILYVACTEAASATNYTARLNQYDAVTIEGFTGAIYGLWASDAGGNARISEFS